MFKEQVVLRLSKSDKTYLKEQADKERLTLSSYIRRTIMSKDVG